MTFQESSVPFVSMHNTAITFRSYNNNKILTNKRDNITVKGTVASSDPFVLYQVKQLLSNVIP